MVVLLRRLFERDGFEVEAVGDGHLPWIRPKRCIQT
jgi:hypothetical protein